MSLIGLVVIPTYNEKENIEPLVKEIYQYCPDINILVVDDNSPDGTSDKVQQLQKEYQKNLHLMIREKKNGLGRAYIAGFHWGLKNKFDFIVEMDADFSHRPIDLKNLVSEIKNYDFIIGSRWIKNGKTLNWSLWRKLISIGGSIYSRLILGYPVRDWTGGFNLWKSHVLEKMNLKNIQSEGYSFQIELKYRASRLGFLGKELPIVFDERRQGQSKMSSKIVLEALYRVWWIKFQKMDSEKV